MTTPSNDEVWALFHRMWGDSKAQRSYVKADWLALQAMLLERIGDRERQSQPERSQSQVFFGPSKSVGPRPGRAIQQLTTVVVGNELAARETQLTEDLKRVLDYMTFLEMKASLVDSLMVQLMRLPELVANAVAATEAAEQPNDQCTKWVYNVVGHICPETNRKAMTVAQVLELMKDDHDSVHSFEYDQESAGLGLDPWRLVDSINQCTKEPKAELWFDNGGSMIVELDSILYVQQPKAKK